MYKLGFKDVEESELKLPTFIGNNLLPTFIGNGKVRPFQKDIYFCFIDSAKAFDYVDNNKWKILKEMEVSDHFTYLLRGLYAGEKATVRTGHEITHLKLGQECHKAVHCHHAYLMYMESI